MHHHTVRATSAAHARMAGGGEEGVGVGGEAEDMGANHTLKARTRKAHMVVNHTLKARTLKVQRVKDMMVVGAVAVIVVKGVGVVM